MLYIREVLAGRIEGGGGPGPGPSGPAPSRPGLWSLVYCDLDTPMFEAAKAMKRRAGQQVWNTWAYM